MSKYKLYQWCEVQKKVVPVEEVMVRVHANSAHMFINDEMPPTRNPLNPKEIYTSKSKLRAAYRAAGAEEVGTEFDRGYNPERHTEAREKQVVANFMRQVKERLNG
jgi:hypothetical protein